MSEGASFETERFRDDQPARDDLLDPDAVVSETEEPEPADERPSSDDLPETQGMAVDEANRLTEDQAARPQLGDEAD